MPADTERDELRVGIFTLIGLVLAGILLFQFGKFGTRSLDTYQVGLVIRDATGVREGIPVRLGGVEIGYVGSDPAWGGTFAGLELELQIFEDQKIPYGTSAKIGTSGLMGDAYVRLTPPIEVGDGFYKEGDRIAAAGASTMDDVARTAVDTLESASTTLTEIGKSVQRLDDMLTRLDGKVLHDENVKNLNSTLENLSVSSGRFEEATRRLGPLLGDTEAAAKDVRAAALKADGAFDKVGETVDGFSKTVKKVDPALADFDATLEDLRSTLTSLDSLVNRIGYGDGLAAALINDPSLRSEVSSLVTKLERNGILFYPRDKERPNANANVGRRSESEQSVSKRGEVDADVEKKGLFSWLKKKQ